MLESTLARPSSLPTSAQQVAGSRPPMEDTMIGQASALQACIGRAVRAVRALRPLLGPTLVALLAAGSAGAQSIKEVRAVGEAFLGFRIDEFRDLAIDDSGAW